MVPERSEIEKEHESEPEAQRALGVEGPGTREVELHTEARDEDPYGRREEEGEGVQLVQEGIELWLRLE